MLPSTFINELESLEKSFSNKLFFLYARQPLPHYLDEQIERFIDAYRSATPDERALLGCLPPFAADVLCAFGVREAALAVRALLQESIVRSLVAIGLATEFDIDTRELMMDLAPPWHSATLLASDSEELFKQAAVFLPAKGARELLAFCQRTPENQTLSCMGYKAGSDEGGFRYVRASWEG